MARCDNDGIPAHRLRVLGRCPGGAATMEVTLHMKGFQPKTYVFCTACSNAFIHRYVGEKGHRVTTRVCRGSRDPMDAVQETSAPERPRREMSWREFLFGKRRRIL